MINKQRFDITTMQIIRRDEESVVLAKLLIGLNKEALAKCILENGWNPKELNRKELHKRVTEYTERLVEELLFVDTNLKDTPEFQECLKVVAFYFPELGKLSDFI